MRKSVVFLLFAMLTAMLSGCILSKTPNTNDVTMNLGEEKTFSVNVFPPATYAWTLDGSPLSTTGKSIVISSDVAGNHILTVKAKHILGTDTQTWNLIIDPIITSLLNSLVSIPAGTFQMGSTCNINNWAFNTTPVHTVTLSEFYIGATEVTQAQYQAVMGANPSYNLGAGHENCPVENVGWYNARQFCANLSAMTGRTFTLPSEAQWEYACRAGSTTLYSYGDSDALLGDYAWYSSNSGGTTHPVGTKLPNSWGLYDMHGNVWEWCLDSLHVGYTGAPTDGSAWEPDIAPHMCRGGCWIHDQWSSLTANRILSDPVGWDSLIGFRIVEIP
jgi:hypothetical protein